MVYRNYALARELILMGHDVTIVTSFYAHTRKFQPPKPSVYCSEVVDEINYFWLPGFRYSPDSILGRVSAMFGYTVMATLWLLLKIRRGSFDFVIGSAPYPTVIYPAFLASRISGAQLIFDIRDLWPLTLKKLGGYSAHHPFIYLLQCAEDFACRKSDLVLAVPQNCERYLRSRGLRANRFLHMPNGVGEANKRRSLSNELRGMLKELRSSGQFIVGYTGAIGLANSLDCLIEALALVDPCVVLVLVGHGERVGTLRELAADIGVAENVKFIGRISKAEVADLLSLVDVAYVAAIRSTLYRFGASPTKVNDYLLAAVPVIYGVGDTGNPVALAKCGIEFRPESVDSCAAALTAILNLSPSERLAMGKKGREWICENQSWSKQAEALIEKATTYRGS